MRKRWDAASHFVVFQELPGPFKSFRGKDAAFDWIVTRSGYEPVWEERGDRVILRLRHRDGAEKGSFAQDQFEIANRWNFAASQRELIGLVLTQGLCGWKSLPSDRFTIEHGMAEQKRRAAEA